MCLACLQQDKRDRYKFFYPAILAWCEFVGHKFGDPFNTVGNPEEFMLLFRSCVRCGVSEQVKEHD